MIRILLLFLLISLTASSNPVFIKIATKEIPPLTFTAIRFIGAAIILFPFWYKKKQLLQRADLLKILPFSLNMGIFSIGIQYSSVVMAGILYSLGPILTAVFAHYLLKEKFVKAYFFGLVLAIIGVVVLLKGSIETKDILSFGTPIGNLLILLAVFCWSLYPVGSRVLSKSYDSSTITFYSLALTAGLSLIISPLEWFIRPLSISTVSFATIISILGGAFIGSALAYFAWQLLIRFTSAFLSTLVQYTGVIVSVVYGVLFFGERLTLQLVVGATFIVAGAFLATTYTTLKKL